MTQIENEVFFRSIGYPRIHFGLADMGGASKRMYGGCGISIYAYSVCVDTSKSDSFELQSSGFISNRTRQNLLDSIQKANLRGLNTNCKMIIHSNIPQHIGLGSSTQIILTALDALANLYNWEINASEIADISGRGRTSLIGISTHYYGGFCVDAGQPYEPGFEYEPSHHPGSRHPSLFIGNWEFPENWEVSLFEATLLPSLDTSIESAFMLQNAPTEREAGLETIAAIYHGILPSIINSDYDGFAEALKTLNCVGFENMVQQLQPKVIVDILNELWSAKIASGVSSFGPIVFVIHTHNMIQKIRSIGEKFNIQVSGPFQVIQMKKKV